MPTAIHTAPRARRWASAQAATAPPRGKAAQQQQGHATGLREAKNVANYCSPPPGAKALPLCTCCRSGGASPGGSLTESSPGHAPNGRGPPGSWDPDAQMPRYPALSCRQNPPGTVCVHMALCRSLRAIPEECLSFSPPLSSSAVLLGLVAFGILLVRWRRLRGRPARHAAPPRRARGAPPRPGGRCMAVTSPTWGPRPFSGPRSGSPRTWLPVAVPPSQGADQPVTLRNTLRIANTLTVPSGSSLLLVEGPRGDGLDCSGPVFGPPDPGSAQRVMTASLADGPRAPYLGPGARPLPALAGRARGGAARGLGAGDAHLQRRHGRGRAHALHSPETAHFVEHHGRRKCRLAVSRWPCATRRSLRRGPTRGRPPGAPRTLLETRHATQPGRGGGAAALAIARHKQWPHVAVTRLRALPPPTPAAPTDRRLPLASGVVGAGVRHRPHPARSLMVAADPDYVPAGKMALTELA